LAFSQAITTTDTKLRKVYRELRIERTPVRITGTAKSAGHSKSIINK